MPGVDFSALQGQVPMAWVLELVGFVPRSAAGDRLRGPCPVHGSQWPRSRSFSVHLGKGLCYCHKCGFGGNQIQLWAGVRELRVYEAAVDLRHRLGIDVPWIQRRQEQPRGAEKKKNPRAPVDPFRGYV